MAYKQNNILLSLAGFVAAYLSLDWVSNIQPLHGLNITPWNPAPAVGLIALLRFGAPAVLALAFAILIGDVWVRGMPAPPLASTWLAVQLTLGYSLIALALRRTQGRDAYLEEPAALLKWAMIVACGCLANSLLFVATLTGLQLIAAGEATSALLRYWLGDMVGILVSMPFLWMLTDTTGRARLAAVVWRPGSIPYLLLVLAVLWLAFGLGPDAKFKYFYVLFLPIVWAAVRHGMVGAVSSSAIMQIGIIAAVQWLQFPAVTILEIQALTLVMAFVGFFIGIVVDEKQRVSTELRQSLRLAAAGEMAGALAHELNQPLTALSAYANACELMLEKGSSSEDLRRVIGSMLAESHRAATVLRRLRDFFKSGATQFEEIDTAELIAQSTASLETRLKQLNVELEIDIPPHLPLLADRLQLEVVLRNLLSNALDAIAAQDIGKRRIAITARRSDKGTIRIVIEDSGPGVSASVAEKLFEAFETSKSHGMGLGLSISRAIVETHGGSLNAVASGHGEFVLTLPSGERSEHASTKP